MAKSQSQKLKILYLMQMLWEKTDETHYLTLQQMLDGLSQYGITAERKSLYDDLEQLRRFGMDIGYQKGQMGGYHVLERPFQLAELKLLVDSVQASKFITHKKSMELIKKIESLTSTHEAQQLQRQVYVAGRIKAMNESVYYNVDQIYDAIGQNRQVRFQYFEYTVDKKREFRHDGAWYQVSPFALQWADENYYMIAFDEKAQKLKHYRVDKMTGIAAAASPRVGEGAFAKLDLGSYTQKVFSMYGGEEEMVTLQFPNRLIGVVMDRFGKDITVFKENEDAFTIHVRVALSPQFYGWVFALGDGVRILGPSAAVSGMQSLLAKVAAQYALGEE